MAGHVLVEQPPVTGADGNGSRQKSKKLRETLRKQRRKLVATIAGAKKEPATFKRLVDLQAAFDAVEWALEDEEALANRAMHRP